MICVKNYFINERTMTIMPVHHEKENSWYTVAFEIIDLILVKQPPLQVIKDSCIHYGMTYDGLKKGTTHLLGPGEKMGPIKLSGALDLFTFPTTFPTKPDCGWLLFNHIVDFHPNGKQTLVQFTNGLEMRIALPFHLMENRYHMTTKLISKWTHTLEEKLHYELEGRTDGLYIHKLDQSDVNYTIEVRD